MLIPFRETQRGFTEIFSKTDIFSAPKTHHTKTTTSPANHHNFTTKNHPKNTRFSPTPFKKASIDGHKKAAHQGRLFF
jgi:hypothetical protein